MRHPHSNQGVTANQKLSLFLSDLNSEKMLTVIKRIAQTGLRNCVIPNKIHIIFKLFAALSSVGCFCIQSCKAVAWDAVPETERAAAISHCMMLDFVFDVFSQYLEP